MEMSILKTGLSDWRQMEQIMDKFMISGSASQNLLKPDLKKTEICPTCYFGPI